jgi:apolipoprotein D and lipocalin family protein
MGGILYGTGHSTKTYKQVFMSVNFYLRGRCIIASDVLHRRRIFNMATINQYLLLSCALLFLSARPVSSASLKYEPVSGFHLDSYLGKWYEIARLPFSYEKGLINVTATYSLRKDGKVKVVNEGYRNTKDGKHKVAAGKAKLGGSPDQGYFRVSFFGPFYGDYIILELDPEYNYAMVASSPKYLWILSRKPQMDKATLDTLIEKANKLGFDTSRLYYTPQEW